MVKCEAISRNKESVSMFQVIKPIFRSTSSCLIHLCTAHELARAKKGKCRSHQAESYQIEKGTLAADQYILCDFVSMEQFVFKTSM